MSYTALSLGLFIFIFAYFTLNAPRQEPQEETKTNSIREFCKLEDPAAAPTFKAPADNVTKTGNDDDELLGTPIAGGGCGGTKIRHVLGNTVTYRLIRSNVPMSTLDVKKRGFNWEDKGCHFDTAEKLDIDIPEIDKTKFKVFYPEISGEISLDKQIYSRTRTGQRDLMYFIDYGLVFLLQINPDGSFTELKGGTTQGQSETFYLVDIYQDIDSGRPELPPEAFACNTSKGTSAALGTRVIQPNQDISTSSNQLQLQYFVFNTGADSNKVVNGWGVHCKPAVYLYPPKKQLVNVKVTPSGFLTYVDPPYDADKGWTATAFPSGKLEVQSSKFKVQSYDYLYFESKIRDEVIKKPEKGWVRKFDELESLYNDILPKLGLNEKQVNLEDYEEVRNTWQENYRKLEPPLDPSGKPKSRAEWLKEELKQIPTVIDLLASGDPARQEQGKRMVSKILPFLLLGGFSNAEIIAYLKAKLEAAKAVLKEILQVEEKREDEETKVEAQRPEQNQKTMAAEAPLPADEKPAPSAQPGDQKAETSS